MREFAAALERQTKLPVKLWDERLTSVEAGRVLRSSGISIEKRAAAVDRLLGHDPAAELSRFIMSLMRGAGVLVVVVLAAAGTAAYRLATPYRGFQADVFVEIPRGAGTGSIAERLAEAGVVRSRWDFLLARMVEPGLVLQAGEYRFQNPATTLDVMRRIARGDVFYYTLVIPEGKNMFDIAWPRLALGLFDEKAFLTAARDSSLISDLDPHAPTLEGYLFPGSYRLARQTSPRLLCQKMTERFREVWRGLHADTDVHDTVTLASMVEKEAKLPEERPRIAQPYLKTGCG